MSVPNGVRVRLPTGKFGRVVGHTPTGGHTVKLDEGGKRVEAPVVETMPLEHIIAEWAERHEGTNRALENSLHWTHLKKVTVGALWNDLMQKQPSTAAAVLIRMGVALGVPGTTELIDVL